MRPAPAPPSRPAPAQPIPRDIIDDALLHELEVTLDDSPPVKPVKPAISLDDEMTKLLGELSSHKR
jgi:hypothetical protein